MSLMQCNVQFNMKMFSFSKKITDAEKDEFFVACVLSSSRFLPFYKTSASLCLFLKKQAHKTSQKTQTNTISVDLHSVCKSSCI